ncbi:MAG: hypothetical protein NXI24_06610 [bacterium]|nr:hypothetical protein [bacterium]
MTGLDLNDPDVFLSRLELQAPGREFSLRIAARDDAGAKDQGGAQDRAADEREGDAVIRSVFEESGTSPAVRGFAYRALLAFTGPEDRPESGYMTLYASDQAIAFRHAISGIHGRLPQRRLRISLAPIAMRRVEPNDAAYPADLASDGSSEANAVILAHYGLEYGGEYRAQVISESYHLPPDEPGGEPTRREQRILRIADSPGESSLAERLRLPLEREWSY